MTEETPRYYNMDLATTEHGGTGYALVARGMTAEGVRKTLLTLPEAVRARVRIAESETRPET